MTQNLKIEVLTGDISIDGMVVTNLVTKEELSTAIVKKADLGTDGKIPTGQLPAEIVNTAGIVDEVKLQLETSIKDAVDESNAYAESYTDNALSSKADLTSGKVPLEQLPTIDQYPQFGTALSNLSTSILSATKQRTDQLEKSKADLGEDGKVLREQIPSYEKISGLPEQLEVMSTQTAAVSGELDEHKLQMFDQIDTLKENIEANVQQLTDRQSHLMRTYATKELGVDAKVGVKPGEYFYVRSANEEEMLIEYQNIGGVPTPSGKSYPSSSYVQEIAEFTALPFVQGESYGANRRVQLNNGDIVKSTAANNTTNPNINMSGWVFDKGAYRASWFADSKSGSDQSLALRKGYLKAVEDGVPFIIDAVFNVNPVAIDAGLINDQNTAFEVVSNSIILFTPEGALRTIPNNKVLSSVMLIANDVENVYIFKPKLIGDRIEHVYVSGTNEWGYGLTIYESKNITVIEPDCSNFIGDGIYVGKVWGSDSENVPTNIFIDRPKIDRCRRNGIAATAWDNLKIMYPRITNCGVIIDGIAGTGPNAGIDVEPEKTTSTPVFRSVTGEIVSPYIENCGIGICTYNEIRDLYFEMLFSGKTTLKDCHVNTSLSNGASGTSGYLTIEDLYLSGTNNSIQAMWSGDGTNQLTISSVTHKSISVGASIVIGGHGSFVNKSIGNMKIHYNNSPHILVFYTIRLGTDLSEFTLSNTSITANSVITHSIDATNTYTRFPKVNLSDTLIRGQTTFQEANISTVDYRGLSIIYLGANTDQNISLHGIPSGSVTIKTPSNTSLKVISGLKLFKKNGLRYDDISTNTPDQEIDFTLGWARDVIDRNTFGWDGLSIENSVTFNPDPIPAKSTISTSVTLPGVKIGDYVAASFSSPDSRVCLSYSVSANDTVTVFFSNISDSIVDLPSGTLRVKQI